MISEHFKRDEFICDCGCGQDTVDVELITVLEDIRNHFGVPVAITKRGGNRCTALNFKAGGSNKSQHILSKASDVKVRGITPLQVYVYLETKYPNKYGLGLYPTFVHVDVRPLKARW